MRMINMNNSYLKVSVGVLVFLMAVVSPAAAKEVVGEIVYIEGSVEVFRDGTKLDWRSVDIGAYIEEFDMVQTGNDGFVEVVLTASGGGTTVQVKPGSSFYFTLDDVEGLRKTEFAVMAGSMAFRVKKLSGNEAFTVRTESVAMGVRGTNFEVTVAPEGSILTTCDEGLVECSTEDGQRVYSRPGLVVEKITDQGLGTAEVDPKELETYRSEWFSLREDVFERGAHVFIKGYGARYTQMRPRFLQAYSDLRDVESDLRQLERINGPANRGALFQMKGRVSPAVIKMRSILPLFENTFFRLEKLSEYHAKGYGRGMINSSTSTDDFFRQFDSLEYEMKQRLSHTYYLLRLYRKLHELTGGGPSFMDSPFDGGEGMPRGDLPEGFGSSPF
jgi:hypothetical protein